MDQGLLIALVSGGSALGGSLITGLITLKTSVSQKKIESYKRRLIKSYQDIAAFHRLEEEYLTVLETKDKSADAWKKEVRKNLRGNGFDSPGKDATALSAESYIKNIQ